MRRVLAPLLSIACHGACHGALDIAENIDAGIDEQIGHRPSVAASEVASEEIHDHIRSFALAAGVAPERSRAPAGLRISAIAERDLPARVRRRVADELAARSVINGESSAGEGRAELSSEAPFLAILDDGDVVGFLVSIDDVIDHPGWGGSGVHLYLDVHGAVVTDIEWSG